MPLPLELSDSSSTTVPEHFKILIENLLIERKQFKDNYKILPKFLKLDYELIYCVAITVALETGFRLGNTLSTFGFDIRAMRELNSFERFRDIDGERLKATLNLPYFPSWTLRIISIPLIGDLALYDILAVEEDEVKFSSSVAVSCSKYLTLLNKGLEMFKDLEGLSKIFIKEFRKMRNEIYKTEGFNHNNIQGLPDEVKRLIFVELSAKDFVNLCLSSQDLLRFIRDNKIWSYFLTRDFKVVPADESISYQTYYNIMINETKNSVSAENSNYSGTTMISSEN